MFVTATVNDVLRFSTRAENTCVFEIAPFRHTVAAKIHEITYISSDYILSVGHIGVSFC